MAFIRKIRKGNRVYLAEVENYRKDGKVCQRHIRYLGLDPEFEKRDIPLYSRNIKVESVKVYGPVIILENIARELGFFEFLGDIANPISVLAFAHCLDYKSVSETAEWFAKTDLPSILGCEKITAEQYHSAFETLDKFDFEVIEKSISEKMNQLFGEDNSGMIYDGTNTHLTGSLSNIAKQGKSKDGVKGRNLIQIGLGVTRSLGIPIFHQVHPGNIHDTKMFNEAISKFSSLEVKSGLAVFDRGITSQNCISKLALMGWRCLAGLQMHKGVKTAISVLVIVSRIRWLRKR